MILAVLIVLTIFLSSLCVTLAISLRTANARLKVISKQLADNLTRLVRNRR